MSAFRVFGVSYQKIHDDLYRKEAKGKDESITDYGQRIKSLAMAAYLKTSALKPVSDMFDAPQFCEEFIRRADKTKYKHLTIRVHALNGKIDEKTREPKRSWVKWEEGKKYITSLDRVA